MENAFFNAPEQWAALADSELPSVPVDLAPMKPLSVGTAGAAAGAATVLSGLKSYLSPMAEGSDAVVQEVRKVPRNVQVVVETYMQALEGRLRDQHQALKDQLSKVHKDLNALNETMHVANLATRLQGFAERLELSQHQSMVNGMPQHLFEKHAEIYRDAAKKVVHECVDLLHAKQEEQIDRLHRRQFDLIENAVTQAPRALGGTVGFSQAPPAETPASRRWEEMMSSGTAQGGAYTSVHESVREPAREPAWRDSKDQPPTSDGVSSLSSDENEPVQVLGEVSKQATLVGTQTTHKKHHKHDRNASERSAEKDMKSQVEGLQRSYSKMQHDERLLPRFRKREETIDFISGTLVFTNLCWMGAEVEVGMASVTSGVEMPAWVLYPNIFFAVAFSLEMIVKLCIYRAGFFTGPQRKWNIFDVVLVIATILDMAVSSANLSCFRVLRGLRAVRAARILRTVKVVRELRLMVASIICSIGSLFWAFVLLILVLLLCAMGIQQMVHSHLEEHGLRNIHPRLLELYGTLASTMLSLFMAISGGADWKDLVEPLEQISKGYLLLFVIFVILVVFGLLNILTAVFVGATSRIVDVDSDLVIQERLDDDTNTAGRLHALLVEAAEERMASEEHPRNEQVTDITRQEFEDKLSDPRFRAQLQLLDLAVFEARSIFNLLGVGLDETVPIEELVFGLMRLKGAARAMDLASMQLENKKLVAKLGNFMKSQEEHYESLKRSVMCSVPLQARAASKEARSVSKARRGTKSSTGTPSGGEASASN